MLLPLLAYVLIISDFVTRASINMDYMDYKCKKSFLCFTIALLTLSHYSVLKRATTISIMTFSKITLSIIGLAATLTIYDSHHNDTQHYNIECYYTECRYAECRYAKCRGTYRNVLQFFYITRVYITLQ
jgi:hypothetical protein